MNPTLDSGEPFPTSQYNHAVLGQGSFYSIVCDKERREPWHLKCPFLDERRVDTEFDMVTHTEHAILVQRNEEAFKYPCGFAVLTKQDRLQIGYTYDYIYMDIFENQFSTVQIPPRLLPHVALEDLVEEYGR